MASFSDHPSASGESLAALREIIHRLAEQARPSIEDALNHADGALSRGRLTKFDRCLPKHQYAELVVQGLLDVEGARRAVAAAVSI